MEASNVAYPNPGTLTGAFGAFAMADAIHLGSRADQNADRHFLGRMAGLMISKETLAADQVGCIFTTSEEFLPAQLAECSEAPLGQLSVSFLNTMQDVSGNGVAVTPNGAAELTFSGVQFTTLGDYVTVADFPYETGDNTFSVSFWMTKEACTGGIYEYLYSHMTSSAGDDMWTTSSINIYLGCEEAGGGWSTVSGSVIRFNVVDTTALNPMFDFPLHESGDFDAVTNVWVHVILSASTTRMQTWDDGMKIDDSACSQDTVGQPACPYHYYADEATQNADPAFPKPSVLQPQLAGFSFGDNPIYLGARADMDADRRFVGRMSLVDIYDYEVTKRRRDVCSVVATPRSRTRVRSTARPAARPWSWILVSLATRRIVLATTTV